MTSVSDIQLRDSIDHLFRHHAGRMVSVLSRTFGFDRIDMIEDAVQDALIAALRKWPFAGMPDNPTAWLTQTAKNRLIDRLRRDSRSESADDGFDIADAAGEKPVYFQTEIAEDQLRMIFACCHPSIPPDSQVALTLKTVGGFSVVEIARAYLSNTEAVSKMLTRAKQRVRGGSIRLEIPVAGEINVRLDAVLRVLYLMFNEGYGASGGGDLVRRDLCFEAIRLIELLAAHPLTGSPKVHAAAALFHFQAARLPARADEAGDLILLADQDRKAWDGKLIARGLEHMRRSGKGDELTTFHLEAEIAGIYSLSPDFASIDWQRVLECYDLLRSSSFSPVAELNRVIVVSRIEGAAAALAVLNSLVSDDLERYNLFHITRGHLLFELGRDREAGRAFNLALSLTQNEAIRRFIEKRICD